ncbi:MAG: aldose 1-epimerase [Actinomycetota bacterium]|nr:aldose 1-epimerase [Actinomycetota bacterium]
MTTSPRRSRPPIPTPVAGIEQAAIRSGEPAVHRLESDTWRVGVLPRTGGSLAYGMIRVAGAWVNLLRPTPAGSYGSVEDCASFVMLPWSNRIGEACLGYAGRHYPLRINAADGTAIHGTAREFPWEVMVADGSMLIVSFDSRRFHGVNYPWPFSATIVYEVSGSRFTVTTELRNQHDEAIPVGFGHHPYFARSLSGPDDVAHLELPFDECFELEKALPTGPPTSVDPRVDFRSLRPLGDEFVDDCLTSRRPGAPVRIVYPASGRRLTMGADDVFTHLVVYVPQDRPFFAVEPVTNANDAFQLHERGIPESGLVVLSAGEALRGSFWLDLEN